MCSWAYSIMVVKLHSDIGHHFHAFCQNKKQFDQINYLSNFTCVLPDSEGRSTSLWSDKLSSHILVIISCSVISVVWLGGCTTHPPPVFIPIFQQKSCSHRIQERFCTVLGSCHRLFLCRRHFKAWLTRVASLWWSIGERVTSVQWLLPYHGHLTLQK